MLQAQLSSAQLSSAQLSSATGWLLHTSSQLLTCDKVGVLAVGVH